ncbi:hypothetical protein ACOSQ2_004744 [Xanthoceras sorbifolium]
MTYHLNQDENNQASRGDSILGHRTIYHGRVDAERNLWDDYFVDNPLLFLRIVNAIESHANYFMQRSNAFDRLGLSSLQKITAVFWMLAYGASVDATDEYIKIGESTTIESMNRFCRVVVEVFGERNLRSPNANDVARLLQIGEKHDFLGMLRSIDCIAPSANYVIQGKKYDTGYYLADGIYPKWSTIVQTIHDPQGSKKNSCIIMHNTIIEDERNVHADIENWRETPVPEAEMEIDETTRF